MSENGPTVTIVEPQAAVEPGEHTGEIVETFTQHYDSASGWAEVEDPDDADDPVSYFGVEVTVDEADDFTLRESWSLNNGRIHENTALGAILANFGFDLETMREEQVDLGDIFTVGRNVRFNVEEEEYEDDEGETQTSLNLADVSPVDEDLEEAASSGSDDSDNEGEVYSIIGGMDEPQESEVLKALAQQDGSLVPTFKDMVEAGDVDVSDQGIVSL